MFPLFSFFCIKHSLIKPHASFMLFPTILILIIILIYNSSHCVHLSKPYLILLLLIIISMLIINSFPILKHSTVYPFAYLKVKQCEIIQHFFLFCIKSSMCYHYWS
jgi:hypothetical protein